MSMRDDRVQYVIEDMRLFVGVPILGSASVTSSEGVYYENAVVVWANESGRPTVTLGYQMPRPFHTQQFREDVIDFYHETCLVTGVC